MTIHTGNLTELPQLRHSIELYPDDMVGLVKRIAAAYNARCLDKWNEASPLSEAQYAGVAIKWLNFKIAEMLEYEEDSLLRDPELTDLLEKAEQKLLSQVPS